MIWSEVKEIWSQGPGEYLLEPWNFLDFGMLAIFLASFSCRFSILRHVESAQTFVYTHYTTLINVTLPPEILYLTLGENVFLSFCVWVCECVWPICQKCFQIPLASKSQNVCAP